MSSQTKSAVWSNGLIGSMDDPELLVISSDSVVIIKDKYPKAQHHFLILPRENIHSIYKVNCNIFVIYTFYEFIIIRLA